MKKLTIIAPVAFALIFSSCSSSKEEVTTSGSPSKTASAQTGAEGRGEGRAKGTTGMTTSRGDLTGDKKKSGSQSTSGNGR